MEITIYKGAAPGLSTFSGMTSIREAIAGMSWWSMVEVRMRGRQAPFVPQARPLPASAFNEVFPDWDMAMRRGDQPMTRDDYQTMTAYHRLAYLNVKQGSASSESWACLALASNMSLVLAEEGYGQEWLPLIREAQQALMRADARGQMHGAWRMDGSGLATVGDMLDIFDAQLEIAPRRVIMEAREIIIQRLADNEVLKHPQK